MIRRPPRSTRVRSSAASDVYKRQKKDFVPALTKAIKDGWAPPEAVVQEHEEAQAKTSADDAEEPRSKAGGMKRSRSMKDVAQGDVVVDYSDEPSGKLVRLAS